MLIINEEIKNFPDFLGGLAWLVYGNLIQFLNVTEKLKTNSIFFWRIASFDFKFDLCSRVVRRCYQGLQLYLKKALAQVFSCEFCQISTNTFSYRKLVAAFVCLAKFNNKLICSKFQRIMIPINVNVKLY